MKNSLFFIILIIFVILGTVVPLFLFLTNTVKDGQSIVTKVDVPNNNLTNNNANLNNLNNPNPLPAVKNLLPAKVINKPASSINLIVPYINESPDNSWTGPWKNACEEACITMVDKYYYGRSSVSISEAKKEMTIFFDAQNKIWGGNANSDAARTAQVVNDYTIYNATIIEKPTISQIKNELEQSRPVIVPLYGFDLHNKNIPFVPAPRGTSYHMLVIIGYDDSTQDFITNDSGDTKDGPNHRYGYDLLMNAIHDYSYVTKHADGPARAIFTYPKLVKTANDPRVYYLHDNIKQWVVDENTFKAKGWSWDAVNIVKKEWLDSFKSGIDIR
ncbi:MAG: C39 family peptidase [Candidatus Parcubacteria bacterium]|nr:C39 family peptidase [Candidatus Parcubacteria bacterium]